MKLGCMGSGLQLDTGKVLPKTNKYMLMHTPYSLSGSPFSLTTFHPSPLTALAEASMASRLQISVIKNRLFLSDPSQRGSYGRHLLAFLLNAWDTRFAL